MANRMPPMTDREARVLTYLRTWCQGRGQGHKRAYIARALEIPDRRLREALASLLLVHGVPVGTDARYGVYLCVEPDDYEEAIVCLYREGAPTLKRMRRLMAMAQAAQARSLGEGKQANLWDGGA